jgi:quinol monooxygenase YgiN
MVITVLRAEVAPHRIADLESAYRQAVQELPSGIAETFLVRDARQPSTFEIVTVWSSRAALDAIRASGVTPRGVQIFRSVGAAPELSILDVLEQGHH